MRTPLAAALLALAAPLARAQVGSSDDLWDFSRGSVVTAHSPFDIDGGDHGGYDPRDAFGGEFNDFPAAFGAVIFTDHQARGSAHFIEWRAAAPIDLERFTMAAMADTHADDLRAVSAFRLYGRDEPGAPWMLLHEAVRTPEHVVGHPLWTIDHEFKSPRRRLLEFRAEFVQASGRTDYGGPRIWELDGFGEYSLAAAPATADGAERAGALSAPDGTGGMTVAVRSQEKRLTPAGLPARSCAGPRACHPATCPPRARKLTPAPLSHPQAVPPEAPAA